MEKIKKWKNKKWKNKKMEKMEKLKICFVYKAKLTL